MRFTHGDVEGRVRFVHTYASFSTSGAVLFVQPKPDAEWLYNRVTVCEVSVLNKNTNEFDGIAGSYSVCHEMDQFNKAVGRRIALTNALHQIADKNLRRSIWKAYFAQHNDGVGPSLNDVVQEVQEEALGLVDRIMSIFTKD